MTESALDQKWEAVRTRLKPLKTPVEIDLSLPLIEEITDLKKKKNAVLLVHNYQVPEIYHGVADFTGDSLGLAREASKTDAELIVFCGVHFMAETAKLLNRSKKVLIPDLDAGCSLSESIRPEDVRRLKLKVPGVPVVCYINTTAAIKAESDICCTSANALRVIESLDSDRIIFIPDEYLAQNIAAQTDKEIISWPGHCMVHEQFTVSDIEDYRKQFPGIQVIAHPECHPGVVAAADFSGSTSGMINFVKKSASSKIMLVTECSMSDNVRAFFPEKDFQVPCTICPHMKKITLEKILTSLREEIYAIEIPSEIASRARRTVQRMMELG